MIYQILNIEIPQYKINKHVKLNVETVSIIGLSAILCLIAALLIFAPQVYMRTYVSDLFSYADGFLRIAEGQMPHRDFNTPTGPLNYYLPYLMMKMGANAFNAIRDFTVLLAIIALSISLYLYKTRLNLLGFVGVASIACLTLMAQVNLGDDARMATAAMFYNRIGFCFLFLLVMFILPAKAKVNQTHETIFFTIVFVFLFFMKFTFGFVALAIITLYGLKDKNRLKTMILSLFLCAVSLIYVEITTHLVSFYAKDIFSTMQSSSAPTEAMFYMVFESLTLTCACIILPLCILYQQNNLKLIDILVAGLCWSCGLLLTVTSAQWGNIFLPLAFIIYAYNKLSADKLLKGVMIAMTIYAVAPMALNIVLVLKNSYATQTSKNAYYDFGKAGKIASYLPNQEALRLVEQAVLSPDKAATLLKARGTHQDINAMGVLREYEYIHTIPFGVKAAEQFCGLSDNVQALDFANPFPVIMGRKPTGYVLFVHPKRVIHEGMNISFERFFKDATCLLEPKLPHSQPALDYIKTNYGNDIAKNYAVVGENDFFIVHRIKGANVLTFLHD